jgi:hypothetical protein
VLAALGERQRGVQWTLYATERAFTIRQGNAGDGLNQFQLFQLHPVGADVGKIVLSLLHKPAFGAAAKHL